MPYFTVSRGQSPPLPDLRRPIARVSAYAIMLKFLDLISSRLAYISLPTDGVQRLSRVLCKLFNAPGATRASQTENSACIRELRIGETKRGGKIADNARSWSRLPVSEPRNDLPRRDVSAF